MALSITIFRMMGLIAINNTQQRLSASIPSVVLLCAILLGGVMLRVLMLIVIIMNFVIVIVIMCSVLMLNVCYAECQYTDSLI